ncbi:EAL domain-containing protein [Bacillus sp. CGMCC 1.16541]|uniref:EAL domain-containing protein n=1 Tax=Bacillus sp. CGMCC 1.16541 TaxID=2185143 RepID=UPI0013A57C7F|nr:EAL domain-containing protein [Bacillus sp. CGMCC 1.16541]
MSWFKKQTQQDLNVYQLLFEEYPQPIILVNVDGLVEATNTLARSLFHTNINQGVNHHALEFIEQQEHDGFQSFIKAVQVQGQAVFHGSIQTMKAETFAATIVGKWMIDGTISLTFQLTQRTDIESLLYVDLLTQLPNRYFVEEQLKGVSSEKRALLILSIESFRFMNETMEYDIHQDLIKHIAIKLQSAIGEKALVARMNDDDFAILLPYYDRIEEVYEVAESLLLLLQEPIYIHTYAYYMPTCIGISLSSEQTNQVLLIEQARFALHMAQKKGRNHYEVYNQSVSASSYRSFLLRMDLQRALQQREFCLAYQPIVAAESEAIVGAEVLLRWNHPDLGIVSPAEFIHLLEEEGLIQEVTYWTLEQVCQQLKTWESQAMTDLRVSINFSPEQFTDPHLLDRVHNIITRYEVNPSQIQIEIVESSFIENESAICHYINELSRLGFLIAIDDFGIGYSALSYLKRFTVNTIKVDKIFVREAIHNKVDFEIIKGLIQIARNLNIQVVAEGVETYEQLLVLQSLQCHFLQGFYFSKPLYVDEFERYMEKNIHHSGEYNQREFHRVLFPSPIEAFVTIQEYKKKRVSTGKSPILLENISGGGIGFLSTIKFPVQTDMILAVTMTLLGESFTLLGTIVWEKEVTRGINQYGVRFISNQYGSPAVLGFIHRLEVQLKKESASSQLFYIYDEPKDYFEKAISKAVSH